MYLRLRVINRVRNEDMKERTYIPGGSVPHRSFKARDVGLVKTGCENIALVSEEKPVDGPVDECGIEEGKQNGVRVATRVLALCSLIL